MYYSSHTNSVLVQLAKSYTFATFVFFAIVAVSPNGLVDTIKGVMYHGSLIQGTGRVGSYSFASYWITNLGATFYIVLIVLGAISGFYLVMSGRIRVHAPWLAGSLFSFIRGSCISPFFPVK